MHFSNVRREEGRKNCGCVYWVAFRLLHTFACRLIAVPLGEPHGESVKLHLQIGGKGGLGAVWAYSGAPWEVAQRIAQHWRFQTEGRNSHAPTQPALVNL